MITEREILKGEDRKKFILRCSLSPSFFFKRVLGKELKSFHKEWFDILTTYDRIAISAPTGFGKTCVFGIAYPIWQAFFKPSSQSLILSKTIRTQSANILDEIKSTIENNEFLSGLVPNDDKKKGWTKEKITTTNNSVISYCGYTQSVRGSHVDYAFCDEIATWPETELFFRDVSSRVVAKGGKLAAVSTPINTTDLLAQVSRNKNYFAKKYPAIVNGESIWPEKFPLSTLHKVREEQGESNFQKNYMCNPRSEAENTIFPLGKVLDSYDFERGFTTEYEGRIFIGCDFAIAKGPTADFDAYVVLEKTEDFFIIKHIEVHKGVSVNAKVNRINQLYETYNTSSLPPKIIIDESNIGMAISNELKKLGLPILNQSFHSKARNNLLINLRNIIDSKKLVIPRSKENYGIAIKLTDELTTQLIGFRESKSKLTGNINYLSTASHDDIVMALAMAAKEATKQKSTAIYVASTN